MIQAARPRDLEEVAWHGEEGIFDLARELVLSANRKTPAETGAMVAEALTFADEPGGTPTSTTS